MCVCLTITSDRTCLRNHVTSPIMYSTTHRKPHLCYKTTPLQRPILQPSHPVGIPQHVKPICSKVTSLQRPVPWSSHNTRSTSATRTHLYGGQSLNLPTVHSTTHEAPLLQDHIPTVTSPKTSLQSSPPHMKAPLLQDSRKDQFPYPLLVKLVTTITHNVWLQNTHTVMQWHHGWRGWASNSLLNKYYVWTRHYTNLR